MHTPLVLTVPYACGIREKILHDANKNDLDHLQRKLRATYYDVSINCPTVDPNQPISTTANRTISTI